MRQSIRSTVSTSSSRRTRRYLNVVLLNNETLNITIEPKGKVQEVFNQVCEQIGLRESEYFGLSQLIDGEYHFVDLDTKVQKLNPKGWRTHSHNGEGGHPLATLYFRVQFYVDHVMLLRERVTRHQYYLQLKNNLCHFNQVYSEEKCFLLAAYALQADHSNYSPDKLGNEYFDPREYFPAWVISKHGHDYIMHSMPQMHADLVKMTKNEAQMHFIRDSSAPPVGHNLHFYKLKKRKTDSLGTAWLGICPKGIEIYEKKKFEIRAVGSAERKFTYYTGSDDRSKYLLSLCRASHLFQMTVQPKLAEIRHLEAEDKRRYKEKYVYTDSQDLARHTLSPNRSRLSSSFASTRGSSRLDQRISVISNTSSNTTSGIVSDKMHCSFDESEDGVEIMIDTPPSKVSNSFRKPHARSTPLRAQLVGLKGSAVLASSPVLSLSSPHPQPNTPMQNPATPVTSSLHHASTKFIQQQIHHVQVHTSQQDGPIHSLHSPVPQHQQQVMSMPKSESVSRNNSSQSQRSGKYVLTPVAMDQGGANGRPVVVPQPAEVQIQRVTLAQTMTVSSTPLPPSIGVVISGVATSGTPNASGYSSLANSLGSNSKGSSLGSSPVAVRNNYINDVHHLSAIHVPTTVSGNNSNTQPGNLTTHNANLPTPTVSPAKTGHDWINGSYVMTRHSTPVKSTQWGDVPHQQLEPTSTSVLAAHGQPMEPVPAGPRAGQYTNPQGSSLPQMAPVVSVGQQATPSTPVMSVKRTATTQQGTPASPIMQQQILVKPVSSLPQYLAVTGLPQQLSQLAISPGMPQLAQSKPVQQVLPPGGQMVLPQPQIATQPVMPQKMPSIMANTEHQYSVTVDAHTTGPSTPLTVLPPNTSTIGLTDTYSPQLSRANQYATQSFLPQGQQVANLPPNYGSSVSAIPSYQVMPPPSYAQQATSQLNHTVLPGYAQQNTAQPSYPLQLAANSVRPNYTQPNQTQQLNHTLAAPPSYPTQAVTQQLSQTTASSYLQAGLGQLGPSNHQADIPPPLPNETSTPSPEKKSPGGGLQIRSSSWGPQDQLQRISPSSAEKRRGRRSKTCPVHDLRPDVVDEIRGLRNKNLSLPMISGLCNDFTLLQHQENCNCNDHMDDREKRLSMDLPSPSLTMNEHGTVVRPVSWHSDTFNLDSQLQAFQTMQSDDHEPPYQNLPAIINSGKAVWHDKLPSSFGKSVNNPASTIVQPEKVVGNGWANTGLPTNSTNGNGYSMFPSRITSGGHSPNSSDTVRHQANVGIA